MSHARRRVVLVAALALAAIAAAVAVVVSRSDGAGRGPLVPAFDGSLGIGWPLELGQRGSVSGDLLIRNTGDRPLVLDHVEGVGLHGGGPDIIGAYLVAPPPSIVRIYGYRVPAKGQALPGAVLRPHEELELVIGVTATQPGRRSFRALAVLYHAGTDSYRTVLPLGLAICGFAATIPRCLDLTLSQGG